MRLKAKNAVEEYVYDMRGQLYDKYNDYISGLSYLFYMTRNMCFIILTKFILYNSQHLFYNTHSTCFIILTSVL